MDCGREAEFTRVQKAFQKDALNKATYFNLQSASTALKCVFSVVPSRWKLKRLFLSMEIAKAPSAFVISSEIINHFSNDAYVLSVPL